jgi:predicted acyltransferase
MTSAASAIAPRVISNATLKNTRLVSLDVLRGLAVAGMILVTDPGTYNAVYRPLLHAQWNGPTPTDMIFPAFLFAVGVAITLSFASRIERGNDRLSLARHVVLRSLVIFFLGVALNGFPDYDLHTLRIPGVLQRIALCYLFGASLYLGIGTSASRTVANGRGRRIAILAGTAAFLLIFYWALIKMVPVPGFGPGRLDSIGNLGAYIDRSLLGTRHMWLWGLTPGYGVTFDPEGLLSTLPAIASLLIGIIAGEWLRADYSNKRKLVLLVGTGFVLVLAGWLLSPLLPLNKKIWTSTFAMFSSGVSMLLCAALYFIVDIKRWRGWTPPALVFGTNAVFAFALSNIVTTLTDRIHVSQLGGSDLTLHEWGYRAGFATWLRPVHASLAYALLIVLLNMTLVYPLYRNRIFLRV